MTTTSAEVNVRPPQQRKHEELASLLGSRNVILGSTLLEPKKAPGTAGEKCSMKLITNAHILKLLGKQSIFHYEVTIFAVSSRSDRKFRVSEPNGPRDRDDFPFLSRRDKCREVFLAFYHTMEQTLKESGNLVYYDLSKTIFTLKKLKFESEGNFIFNIGTVPTLERPDAARYKHYEFNLTPATGFEIGDLSFVTNDVSKMERSLEQFLDIATVQKANLDSKQFIEFSSSRVYLLAPTDYGFVSTECPVFESNHSFLGIGMHKASRIIEGDQGPDQMTPAIVIQTKKSAFHIPDMSVLDKSKIFIQHDPIRVETGQLSQNDYEAICAGLTGIYAEPRYGTSGRLFRIDDITKPNSGNGHNAENTFITHRVSGNISVKQYFQDYCQKTIRFPKAPLLINYRRIGEPAYYPMEFCFILDGQRVKGSQQHPDLLREMIKETAVPPTVLQVHNERVKESLQLVNNEYLTKASVIFDTTPLHVDYRVIGPPIVQYHNNQRQTPASSNSEWHQGNALINAHISNWVAYGFAQRESDSVRRSGLNENMWRAFVDKYVTELQASGINCPTPRIAFCWTTAPNDVLNILHKETLNSIDFALIGHAKGSEGDEVHVTIKAFEQQTEVVTQAISFDVVKEVIERGSPLTIANCINKTNVKMGGLNYALYVDEPSVAPLFDGTTIFLGFAMNFPGGFAPAEVANHTNHQQANGHLPAPNGAKPPPNGANGIATGSNTIPLGSNGNSKQSAPVPRMGSSLAPPSCIGWAATIGKRHRDEYIGDFVYQAPRREERIEVIANVVKRCVECFKQHRKNTLPKRLVILRNGCPEGQFEYIMKYEIPLVKKELEDLGCDAKLTVLVPNRLQDVRFLRQDANSEEKSNEQNIRPGTVVDTVVVHPKRTEFFLNSHVAIKGTARTPHYTVLMDENDLSMDTLQAMVHYLCFGHQIVTKPTSLPSPVYIANEYAKRGRNIYSHYSKNGIDHSKNLERFVKSKGVEWPLRRYEDMTKVLSYIASTYLKELRVNA